MAYTLVRDPISHDTVEALEQLLEAAKAGHVLGLVFGAMLRRKRFVVDATGEARRSPTFSRGMAAALDDELRSLVQGDGHKETTI